MDTHQKIQCAQRPVPWSQVLLIILEMFYVQMYFSLLKTTQDHSTLFYNSFKKHHFGAYFCWFQSLTQPSCKERLLGSASCLWVETWTARSPAFETSLHWGECQERAPRRRKYREALMIRGPERYGGGGGGRGGAWGSRGGKPPWQFWSSTWYLRLAPEQLPIRSQDCTEKGHWFDEWEPSNIPVSISSSISCSLDTSKIIQNKPEKQINPWTQLNLCPRSDSHLLTVPGCRL